MEANNIGAGNGGGIRLPGAGREFPAISRSANRSSAPQTALPRIEAVDLVGAAEKGRFEKVRTAAENLFKDVFAVSDTAITIFKDASGEFITRFRNLRDGSITYIPEPDIIKAGSGSGAYANIAIDV